MLKDYSEIQEAARLFDELIKHQQVTQVPGEVDRKTQLENALVDLCQRAGFNSAVLVDTDGFSLAIYNSPVEPEKMAGFTTVLATVLEQVDSLLGHHDANHVSLDITSKEKAVLKQFPVHDAPFFLMIICPQDVDERNELELAVEQISVILE